MLLLLLLLVSQYFLDDTSGLFLGANVIRTTEGRVGREVIKVIANDNLLLKVLS